MTIKRKGKSVPLDDTVLAHRIRNASSKPMVIVHDYWLDGKTSGGVFYVRSRETQRCPICGSKLSAVGSRKRGMLEESGEKKMLRIRRLWCDRCERIHHELPDVIVPYKRYGAEAIENILAGKPEEAADCPCELSTAKRIKLWFFLLREYYESVLESLKEYWKRDEEVASGISRLLPLSEHRHFSAGWLANLVRLLVNSNRWLHTRSAQAAGFFSDRIV